MDNLQIIELINRCKHLKHRFRGIFLANLAFNTILKRDNTFMIVNASNSDQPGSHWLLSAQACGQICFADPLGRSLHNYPHVYKNMRRSIHEGNQILMNKPIQSANSVLCGLYCIYVAHVIISSKFPGFKVNDHDMMRFAKHMMLKLCDDVAFL